jgi:hypothetical protein
MRKKTIRDAVAAPALLLSQPARAVNSLVQNIFNGLLRVPVNEKIPALNSI